MLKFFSFCCYINRIDKSDLIFGLKMLLSSLDYHVKDYQFILYTNFDINIENKNLIIRKYYDNNYKKYYNDEWLNLSFNKIHIYKDLYDEFNEDYIWIDLDTIIVYDISYLDNISNFFIEHGGICDNYKHDIIKNVFSLPLNKYIQGAIWKVNINLYNSLMDTFNDIINKNLIIEYDIQGVFAYYFYYILNGELDKNNINIYGVNFKNNTLNGLGMWSNNNENTHLNKFPSIEALNNMYYENNILKTKYYPDKEIHFAMFTFFTLRVLKDSREFLNLFSNLIEN